MTRLASRHDDVLAAAVREVCCRECMASFQCNLHIRILEILPSRRCRLLLLMSASHGASVVEGVGRARPVSVSFNGVPGRSCTRQAQAPVAPPRHVINTGLVPHWVTTRIPSIVLTHTPAGPASSGDGTRSRRLPATPDTVDVADSALARLPRLSLGLHSIAGKQASDTAAAT